MTAVIMIIPITTTTMITHIPTTVTLMSLASISISANIMKGMNIITIGIKTPIA
ncbi:MAG TPA: hypothetical protein VK568_17605 [Thermodesulfobacteriota bacterium]|nr:hypothetical protein [Thermodesulfobacteriota bacterium]